MILSIESSCDDSSIAITRIKDSALLYHKKLSQESQHSQYGGVVPELASRLHTEFLPLVLQDAKAFLGDFSGLKAIAVTTEPGLSVSLIEGLTMAKTLCLGLQIPIITINHLIGHFYSLFINQHQCTFPMSVLLVSGGHTQIIEAISPTCFKIIAKSMDDSFGECFDKVAKMLNLGYPGGPIIEQYAKAYHNSATYTQSLDKDSEKTLAPLPLPLKHDKTISFSFSGLKNATRLMIQNQLDSQSLNDELRAYMCASFQQAAIEHICDKTHRYFKTTQIKNFAIVGGASANEALRTAIQQICDTYHAKLFLAPLEFCQDNAAMIGRAGVEEFKAGHFSDIFECDISPKTTSKYFD